MRKPDVARLLDCTTRLLLTIGIASYGPSAGEAVFTGLLGAELLGRGAIGGFAVFAILDSAGNLQYRTTQEGGLAALSIPASWREARVAAAISSGPNRPEPLIQFLTGRSGLGLVTGHRLPNSPDRNGRPVNEVALEELASSCSPKRAVDLAMTGCDEIDAGLIAVSTGGELAWRNSARVRRRHDLGDSHHVRPECGFALMHNSIFVARGPCQFLADTLAGLIRQTLTGEPTSHWIVHLKSPILVQTASRDCIHIDSNERIVALETANANLLTADRVGAVSYLAADVWRDGRKVGEAETELFARLREGAVFPPNQDELCHLIVRRCDVAA